MFFLFWVCFGFVFFSSESVCLCVNRYNTVVEACALQTDFETLVLGDLTEVGAWTLHSKRRKKET